MCALESQSRVPRKEELHRKQIDLQSPAEILSRVMSLFLSARLENLIIHNSKILRRVLPQLWGLISLNLEAVLPRCCHCCRC